MKPAVRLIGITVPVDDSDYDDSLGLHSPLDLIEYAGRWDYGERNAAKLGTKPTWLQDRLNTGEESMVEMVDAIFMIDCSRVVSHELVRHRIASYQQESQRFTNYEHVLLEDLFIVPGLITGEQHAIIVGALTAAKEAYSLLLETDFPKQLARYVLPNATRTTIIAKMNLREWRHVLKLRMHSSAQPEIREVMTLVHAKLQSAFGEVLFPDNIAEERGAR